MTKFTKIDGSEPTNYDVLEDKAQKILARLQVGSTITRNFAEYALHIAQRRRTNAGFSGAYDDGGASAIEAAVDAWISGLNQTIPSANSVLGPVYRSFNRDTDPRYEQYLRLKAEFEQ